MCAVCRPNRAIALHLRMPGPLWPRLRQPGWRCTSICDLLV
jgi:hypothetical protein